MFLFFFFSFFFSSTHYPLSLPPSFIFLFFLILPHSERSRSSILSFFLQLPLSFFFFFYLIPYENFPFLPRSRTFHPRSRTFQGALIFVLLLIFVPNPIQMGQLASVLCFFIFFIFFLLL